ncbi:PIR protein [Plasmodium sp. DRC-Itaito]|nr:PIR protein [Plasmodium sp. DRC-Itaito]
MKLHYFKILLFFILLNILVTLYQAHNNNNERQTTPQHTPIYISRMLSECDTQSSSYDNNPQMKSVMQQFDDRTSQRFEEYKERLKDKRQKRKEERDKNIQKIIDTDKREKSLAQKVEIGCLRCGCALGGVAASVGVFGGLGVYGSKSAAWAAITAAAKDAGIKKGLEVGLEKVIVEVKLLKETVQIPDMNVLKTLTEGISGDNLRLYDIFKCISSDVERQLRGTHQLFFEAVNIMAEKTPEQFNAITEVSSNAVTDAVIQGKADVIATAHAEYAQLYSAIGYSVLAILIIVLVLIIIYLVLRYRRKKRINKKAQYTKLLNE